MKKIKTGVIGCGKVGDYHARCYQELESSEFVAVCNHNIARAEACGEKYGVRAYDSVKQMVEETGVEAVSICTPHPAHMAMAVEAADLGLHVAIEKPLASTLADCDAIIEAVKKSSVTASMVCQRRFYRPAQRVHQAIVDGKIGKPILGSLNMLGWRDMAYYHSDPWRGTWKGEGGGVLVNQSVHQMDLLLWYMGEIDSLYGMWDTLNHPELEVDDTAVAVIRFKSGALGVISVSNSQDPALFGNVRVHGSNGASVGVQTDGGAMFIAGMTGITEPPVNDLWTVPGEEGLLDQFVKEDSDFFRAVDSTIYFHKEQLADFLDAVQNHRQPLVTLEDGRRTVELFTAIYRSQRDKKLIQFPLKPEEDDLDWRK